MVITKMEHHLTNMNDWLQIKIACRSEANL